MWPERQANSSPFQRSRPSTIDVLVNDIEEVFHSSEYFPSSLTVPFSSTKSFAGFYSASCIGEPSMNVETWYPLRLILSFNIFYFHFISINFWKWKRFRLNNAFLSAGWCTYGVVGITWTNECILKWFVRPNFTTFLQISSTLNGSYLFENNFSDSWDLEYASVNNNVWLIKHLEPISYFGIWYRFDASAACHAYSILYENRASSHEHSVLP